MWLSKDKSSGKIHLSIKEPTRLHKIWAIGNRGNYLTIPKSEWKKYGCENLKWEDEPVEVQLNITII